MRWLARWLIWWGCVYSVAQAALDVWPVLLLAALTGGCTACLLGALAMRRGLA